ncbi:hypothetical protein FALBO_6354 [Fusarium albosuccineum]|uniref:Fido domain-containing protein n=1 Tax=Fusarium albosuccineum TaxID=1237068 RepID=A0A8H4LBU9_9HYPO|nr:hypothetical protein FALBO_6354 [Fusarium albosuccineum]
MPHPHKRRRLAKRRLDMSTPHDEESNDENSSVSNIEHLGRSIRLMMSSNLHSDKATIKMGEGYDYNILGEDTNPDEIHSELRKYTSDFAKKLEKENAQDYVALSSDGNARGEQSEIAVIERPNSHRGPKDVLGDVSSPQEETEVFSGALDEYLNGRLARMIYGSNMIEQAGGGIETTTRLCRAVFQGQEYIPEAVTEDNPEYEELASHLQSENLPNGHAAILQSYREIVQHAQAARHIIEEVCIKGKDLSEKIILETHGILTYKIDLNDRHQTPWIWYSGVYRTCLVRCGSHVFMHEDKVPFAMRDMIEELDSDIKTITETGEVDPVELASKYCHNFVNIHPFRDGNGRMCRLILNTLLLKYGGVGGIVCIGQDHEDRQEYRRIAVDSSAGEKNTEHLPGLKPKHYKQLASFTLRHARDSMRDLNNYIKLVLALPGGVPILLTPKLQDSGQDTTNRNGKRRRAKIPSDEFDHVKPYFKRLENGAHKASLLTAQSEQRTSQNFAELLDTP